MKKYAASDFFRQGFFLGLGFLSFLLVVLNLIFWIFPVALCAIGKLIIPFAPAKSMAARGMNRIYHWAVSVNDWLFFSVLRNKIDFDEKDGLAENPNCLVLANHRSWVDILVLQSLLNKRGVPIQFIVKRELIFMPLIGLICWAYGYPFVQRASLKGDRKNQVRTKKDYHRIADNLNKGNGSALCLINFVEGTRLNPLKLKKYPSQYRHLLNPRVGGLHYILKNYGEKLHMILNFTIVYEGNGPIFWKFLAGRCKKIRIDLQKIYMGVLMKRLESNFADIEMSQVADWIKELWGEKDAQIAYLRGLTDG